ncbi:Hypothetical protein, putative [Bodo saltans]|uniref:Uncharacterized protein n=1 Tax=Bodo saltans TaxID=75058 RepID=A0A0S4JUI1_BODSA|nr:Hypothetical protein, putative [Bodo saltans]|eukprot:CUG93100.1 Hypothetical protein, putative [Bodo saltans]
MASSYINAAASGSDGIAPLPVARASIFIEGDCVGVRRKATHTHQMNSGTANAPRGMASSSMSSSAHALHDDERLGGHKQQYAHVSNWLQQARMHEVVSHRAEKFSTPREKWARAAIRASTPPRGVGGGGVSPLRTREPIRYSIRRAHDVLREVETRSTGNLLRAASPVMGRPLQTIRPNGLPGPGSYTLPSQF